MEFMKFTLKFLLAPFLCAGMAWADIPEATADAARYPEIQKALSILSDEIARLDGVLQEAGKRLQAGYRGQLAGLRRAMQAEGNLDGILAVDKEIQRFNSAVEDGGDEFDPVPEMPDNALVETPLQVRAAQDAYVRQRNGSQATRQNALDTLTRRFVARLDEFQREYTKGGKIPEALAVRALAGQFREALEAQSVEQLTRTLAGAPEPAAAAEPGMRAPWRQWVFTKSAPFTPDGAFFDNPHLPADMHLEFATGTGRGRVTGTMRTNRREINGKDVARFGQAMQWRVDQPKNLNATITLHSKEPAIAGAATPAVQILVSSATETLASVTVPLSTAMSRIRLLSTQDARRASVSCEQATPSSTVFDLPENGAVTLQVGFFLDAAGRSIDTTFSIE